MSRRKTRRKQKRPKHRRSRPTTGDRFEHRMVQYFNDYLERYSIPGRAYLFIDNQQPIDVLIDSRIMGYVGVECKSIFEDALRNGKLYFDQMAHINSAGIHQFERQHEFLEESGRYGIIAFEMRCMDRIFLIPHRYAYDKLVGGDEYLTLSEVVRNGFMIEPTRPFADDLVSFVRNKCW